MTFRTEKEFEDAVIKLLIDRGWKQGIIEYPTEDELIKNWADILFQNNRQIDSLNDCPLTDSEMQQLMEQIYALRTPWRLNDFINGKSVSICRDNPDDTLHYGKEVSLKIYDPNEIANGESSYKIARQPKFKTAPVLNDRRGDLMLLINGMPVIHIELKRSDVPVSQAYNQIEKYAHEGVFTGLFSLVQVFVAMTPDETVYFANPGPDATFNKAFYFHWANEDNIPFTNWKDVVSRLLNIPMAHTLIGFYTIADEKDNTLKVMRSYQYYAADKIAEKVKHKDWRDLNPLGGYVWHTTGSGKTLTSFKAAQLIDSFHDADKVIFLVDRRALGKQALDDYNDFSGNRTIVHGTEDGTVLMAKLKSNSRDDSLIVTSIQKLSNITKDNENIKTADLNKIVAKKIVIIIDEAHRSTFGEMLTNIKDTFKYAIIFGFTGTPIQDVNEKKGNTTTTIFGDEIHRYTLADGIRDKNVLGFDPYMVMTYRDADLRKAVALYKAKANTVEEALADKRKAKVYHRYMNKNEVPMLGFQKGTRYIKGIEELVPNAQYTRREHKEAVLEDIARNWEVLSQAGKFHAIFATSNIPEAVEYYRMAKEILPKLNITAVFDPNIDNEGGGTLDKEDGIVEILDDYKKMFDVEFSIPSYDKFREDVQLRLAHKKPYNHIERKDQIDILIVVNQMLTGYDSKWINTLYMDKVMDYENLIQAFSRTNRLFGPDKPFGTIRYYRRPHLMQRNIEEAVKAYSGNIPKGLFVDKLPDNLENMNRIFADIRELFEVAGVQDFGELPQEKSDCKKFAKWFADFNTYLEAASIQGFHWDQNEYVFDELKDERTIVLGFTHEEYLTLARRYKELVSGGGGGGQDDVPFDIDTHLTEINTDAIDTDYMNTRFKKYLHIVMDDGADAEQKEKMLKILHKSFAMLGRDDQEYAKLFLQDIQDGKVKVTEDKTFRDYISLYKEAEENNRIKRVVHRLGCSEEQLRDILHRKVTETTIDDFGRFEDLVKSVDLGKARRFFTRVERTELKEVDLRMHIDEYLRIFLLNEGYDRYDGVHEDFAPYGSEKSSTEAEGSVSGSGDDSNPPDDINDKKKTTKVKAKKLAKWCEESPALSALMKSGAYACIENRVCPFDKKYAKKDPDGNWRLTDYAKDEENEDKCFLQFFEDDDGKLHYIKLPADQADKTFHYVDEINEDILKHYSLVSEISERMLDEIYRLDFGPSLRELMSRRICDCSTDLLRSTTGLDNRTISNMQRGSNLNTLNVVSACLGIHVPFPVSSELLDRANISINPTKSQDNNIYNQLLTIRWASDYDDIVTDLEADGKENLIKNPHKKKTKQAKQKTT